ncbi:MAG: acyltransferase [Alphaproteobacteria bacterium]|nr:acyltransferase [Alphaproteobacteria bacterium]
MKTLGFTESDKNQDIEVLRAYSVLLVLYEHLTSITGFAEIHNLYNIFNGWVGVDLFFCISGFVIFQSLSSRLFYNMPQRDAIREGVAFWIRRFWRLAPAAWLWLLLGLILIVTYRQAEIGAPLDNVGDGLAAFFNFENFHRHACNVQGQPCGALYPHYWSLSLETQFYLVLPFLMVLLPRRWLTYGLFMLIAVQFAMRRPANGVEIGWFIRTDAIAWGVLIGKFALSPIRLLIEPRFLDNRVVKVIFTVVFIYMLGASQLFWREQFFVGLAALVCAGLVFAASYNKGYIARLFGANDLLLWIGARSFSLYVVHMVVFKAVRQICQALSFYDFTTGGKIAYLVIAYIATFIAAALTYRFVENPLRKIGRHQAVAYLAATPLVERDAATVDASV